MQFQAEMEALLERHVLNGLVDAPWVRTDDLESNDDHRSGSIPSRRLRVARRPQMRRHGVHSRAAVTLPSLATRPAEVGLPARVRAIIR